MNLSSMISGVKQRVQVTSVVPASTLTMTISLPVTVNPAKCLLTFPMHPGLGNISVLTFNPTSVVITSLGNLEQSGLRITTQIIEFH